MARESHKGTTPKGDSTDAWHRGGWARSSVEVPVMGTERRGPLTLSRRGVNPVRGRNSAAGRGRDPDRFVERSTREGRNGSTAQEGSLRPRPGDKSRMSREAPVRFCEGPGVQFPRATRLLLGLIGPKDEAKEIRDRLGEFLKQQLRLTLSEEKTLITHASDEKAKFLGHEITVVRQENLITKDGKRGVNGKIALLMPRTAVQKYRDRYTKKGKIIHKAELINDTEYTIVQRYQSVLRGLYNFYCMSINVSKRM